MKVAIEVTESVSVVKSNVRFSASFFVQKDEFAKAFDAVFKDMKKLTDILSKLEVPAEAVTVTPVRANANWVRVEKKLEDGKNKEYEMVQKGFVANGSIFVELPLGWADDKHKFSSIYTSVDGLKTKSRMTYDFYADDEALDNAGVMLRGMLLDAARAKLNEIMANQPSVSFELSNAVYGSPRGSRGMVAKSCMSLERNCANSVEEEPSFDADTIDNMISLDFAPEFELTDSIATEWKSVKNKKKKEK